jgi:hypothetical protein
LREAGWLLSDLGRDIIKKKVKNLALESGEVCKPNEGILSVKICQALLVFSNPFHVFLMKGSYSTVRISTLRRRSNFRGFRV